MPSPKCSPFPETMKNWRLILCLMGIFLVGAVTGGLVTLRVWPEFAHRRTPEQWRAVQMKRLVHRLDLTPTQVEQIRPIITGSAEELRQLRHRFFQQTVELTEKMEADLASVLTPGQRAELARMQKEDHERMHRWMEEHARHGDPPPPPGPPPDGAPPR